MGFFARCSAEDKAAIVRLARFVADNPGKVKSMAEMKALKAAAKNPHQIHNARNRKKMAQPDHESLIAFARAGDGSTASITEVARGRACNCTCLACKRPMVAKQGLVVCPCARHRCCM